MRYRFFYWLAVAVLMIGCRSLPERPEFPFAFAKPPAETGLVAEVAQEAVRDRQADESGFLLLISGREALEWRLALLENATQAVDLQYFIWKGDTASLLLLDAVIRAADRGVRIRMLLDDLVIDRKDTDIAALDAHPNIDIRIYNPIPSRGNTLAYWSNFAFRIGEYNRRMHNKLMVVDNRIAIIGGRNVADEYFGLQQSYNFVDLGALTVGDAVLDMSDAFDSYWNEELSYPGSLLNANPNEANMSYFRWALAARLTGHQAVLQHVQSDAELAAQRLRALPGQLKWGHAYFLQDSAVNVEEVEAKTAEEAGFAEAGSEENPEGEETPGDVRLDEMLRLIADPTNVELLIISPYFIPRQQDFRAVKALKARGVRVVLLTGGLAGGDHTLVNSHYKKYRWQLLEEGMEIYELQHLPSADLVAQVDTPPVVADFTTLHLKAMVGDRSHCFIGSLNLDPRARKLNTENGLWIESRDLCGALARHADFLMQPDNAWHVTRDEANRLRWTSDKGTVTRQPARSGGQRVSDFFYRLLPVEDQL